LSAPGLFAKHRGLAYTIAGDYFLPGADREDVEQEALVALWDAARRHDPERGPFPAFARAVIHNHLKGRLTWANARKRRLVTDALREWDAPAVADHDRLEAQAELRTVRDALPALTELERVSVIGLASGCTYVELCQLAGATPKQVDNAIQSGRRKLRAALQEEAA
jgi:RNA polymerase sigma factor (sigma-70 family)